MATLIRNGIVLSMVFATFPHALMILVTALSLTDARLYEAADALNRLQGWCNGAEELVVQIRQKSPSLLAQRRCGDRPRS